MYLRDTHILHIKPQYQTFDETDDFNFPSSIWYIDSINMSKKDKHFYEKFENVLMLIDIVSGYLLQNHLAKFQIISVIPLLF